MKFSAADFASSSDPSTLRSPRSKRICLRQGHALLPIAPPSPLFAGINQDDINSEEFPDIVNLKDPKLLETALECCVIHCIIHCEHAVCLRMAESEPQDGHAPLCCNCAKVVKPKASISYLSRSLNTLSGDEIQDIMGATKGTKFDAEMSLHEEDCHRFLTALQAHFGISSELIHTLIHSLSQEIPDTVATAAATEARKMVFDNLVRYFDRTFALYDPKSSIGNRRRDVKSVPFLFELENYLLTVLTDFMEIYCDWLLSSGSQYPPVVQSYIEDGGIPKIVWESWNEIIAYLMRMLQWRDIEEKRQVAEKK